MLAQVDLRTFGQNLILIIGGVLLLSLLLFLGFVAWTGLNMLLFYRGKRRAEREHFRQTRRADGELYPPMIEGICEVCKRGGHRSTFRKPARRCALLVTSSPGASRKKNHGRRPTRRAWPNLMAKSRRPMRTEPFRCHSLPAA